MSQDLHPRLAFIGYVTLSKSHNSSSEWGKKPLGTRKQLGSVVEYLFCIGEALGLNHSTAEQNKQFLRKGRLRFSIFTATFMTGWDRLNP